MFSSFSTLVDRLAPGRWCWCAALVACLGMSGCTSLSLRGDRVAENELSGFAAQLREADAMGPSHAFSNKARQIDRNLGGSRDVTWSDSTLSP